MIGQKKKAYNVGSNLNLKITKNFQLIVMKYFLDLTEANEEMQQVQILLSIIYIYIYNAII